MARGIMPANCTECDSPLRKKGEAIEEKPGTKIHAGRGLCSSCSGRKRPSRQLSDKTQAKVNATRQGLDQFLADRRAREQRRNRRAKIHMVTR